MEPFIRINDLVAKHEGVKEISIIFNKNRIKTLKFGKVVRPITIQYLYSKDKKETDDDIQFLMNIPSTLEDVININGTDYSAIIVKADVKKEYKGVEYYDKGLQVIRNPVIIKELEEKEKLQYQVEEFSF